MTVYLDNNIVSAIARDDLSPNEMTALKELLELASAGTLELRTSGVAHKEIEQYKGKDKRTLQIVYLLLNKIPVVEDHKVLGAYSQFGSLGGALQPLVEDHPISSALRQMGLERTDAHHVMVAIEAKCQVFLTCDGGILKQRAAIEGKYPTRVMRPSELLPELKRGKPGGP